ncbi:uncharacterized protein LOC125068408 [Vanessa atalanta]|uniref:uncharacterized protein LOC125068408 n=1 Tax=Vanessa atalanta TaxID=42275 RepID=UPI001FCD8575|nr:uncharacterized protein LOC125068408 [Vanessa atalanta]
MCNCSKLTYCLGNLAYIFERLASCCALTSVITCIVLTILIMLALGIGLGYNYCYIHMNTEDIADEYLLEKPVSGHATTSAGGLIVVQPSVTPLPIKIDSTMIAPLNIGIDFTYLIQKIRESKQNTTLHLIV